LGNIRTSYADQTYGKIKPSCYVSQLWVRFGTRNWFWSKLIIRL